MSIKTSLLLAERDLNSCLLELADAEAKYGSDLQPLIEKLEEGLAELVNLLEKQDERN